MTASINLPQRFIFRDTLFKRYVMTNSKGEWRCKSIEHVDNDTIQGAYWNKSQIEYLVNNKHWEIVEDLSSAPDDLSEKPKEPEMKFPFEFKCKGYDNITYTAIRLDNEGNVEYTWSDSSGATCSIPKADAKTSIKDGYWIVQSVGEQETKEEIVEPVPEYGIHIDEKGFASGHGITASSIKVGSLSSVGSEIGSLSIKITSEGIDEATSKMERLAQATENVTMAFESLQSMLAGFKGEITLLFGDCINVQTFCCGDE